MKKSVLAPIMKMTPKISHPNRFHFDERAALDAIEFFPLFLGINLSPRERKIVASIAGWRLKY
jgi:hypothetical protein